MSGFHEREIIISRSTGRAGITYTPQRGTQFPARFYISRSLCSPYYLRSRCSPMNTPSAFRKRRHKRPMVSLSNSGIRSSKITEIIIPNRYFGNSAWQSVLTPLFPTHLSTRISATGTKTMSAHPVPMRRKRYSRSSAKENSSRRF